MIDVTYKKNTKSIYLCGSQAMRKMDEDTVRVKNITFEHLMKDAAGALFDYITAPNDMNMLKHAVILCGKGNNGGDGRILGQMLGNAGINVTVVEAAESGNMDDEKLQKIFSQSDIIIDAVFGTGFKGSLSPEIARLFNIANDKRISARRIAVDIPSGVSADDGKADINAFTADKTLTFEFIKPGLVSYPGAEFSGKIVVLPIGFPDSTRKMAEEHKNAVLLSMNYVRDMLPERRKNTNKGDFGKLLAICGSKNMTGAAFLSAMGALRTGVGLLYIASDERIIPILQTKLNEPVFIPLNFSNSESIAILNRDINNYSAILFGCGLGRGSEVESMLKEAVKNHTGTIIFDADGINVLCKNIDILNETDAQKILTPHPGEMARLCGVTADDIQRDRINIACDFAKKYKCVLVLKGASTVIADINGDVYINPTGNPGMAKGGSGDILAGMIASYAAQGASTANAACLGVYLHGFAGDTAKQRTSEAGMLPSDLLNILPEIQR